MKFQVNEFITSIETAGIKDFDHTQIPSPPSSSSCTDVTLDALDIDAEAEIVRKTFHYPYFV